MAIPDHVKKLAMDAVNDKETTAYVRLHSRETEPDIFNSAPPGTLTDRIKRQAMDAVAQNKLMAQIRLVDHEGPVVPLRTPSMRRNPLTSKVVEMHQKGFGAELVQQEMTRDDFGRDHV